MTDSTPRSTRIELNKEILDILEWIHKAPIKTVGNRFLYAKRYLFLKAHKDLNRPGEPLTQDEISQYLVAAGWET